MFYHFLYVSLNNIWFNRLEAYRSFHYTVPPFGYQSVKGLGRNIPDARENRTIDNNLIVPIGKTISNKRNK